MKEASSTGLIQVKVHVKRGQFIRSCQGEGRLLVERVQFNRLCPGKGTLMKGVSSSDLVRVKVGYSFERVQLNRRRYTMKGVSSSDLVMGKIGYSLKRVQFNRPVPAKVRDERVSSTGLV